MTTYISIIVIVAILGFVAFYVFRLFELDKKLMLEQLIDKNNMLANIDAGLILLGKQDEIIYMNAYICEFLSLIDLPLAEGDPLSILVMRLNQYIAEDDMLSIKDFSAKEGERTLTIKLKGLLNNITYYEVKVRPYSKSGAYIGQMLLIVDVTQQEVKKQINNAIIKISMNLFDLKSVEKTIKYFSSVMEDIIDVDYVFATLASKDEMTYFMNYSDDTSSTKLIKTHILHPISNYISDKNKLVYLGEQGLMDAGLSDYLSDYEHSPKVLIACPIDASGGTNKGVLGLLFSEPVAYPYLIGDTLMIIAQYMSRVIEKFKVESQIHDLAYYDQLTALPNRNSFILALEQEIIKVSLSGNNLLGILFLDFSGLKRINDDYGHFVGDELLRVLARKLKDASQQSYFIGRLGGDEFGIFVSSKEKTEAFKVARTILDIIDVPCTINNQIIHITGNIGISIYKEHGIHPEELIHRADEALFEAKAKGKSQYYIMD